MLCEFNSARSTIVSLANLGRWGRWEPPKTLVHVKRVSKFDILSFLVLVLVLRTGTPTVVVTRVRARLQRVQL